ncbi:hypothetical protein IW262DRAFT_1292859 [Armillaria fumosa]|nr:hypothetical protein IW262DRAFT_1292859 [Armillaria fumosa]
MALVLCLLLCYLSHNTSPFLPIAVYNDILAWHRLFSTLDLNNLKKAPQLILRSRGKAVDLSSVPDPPQKSTVTAFMQWAAPDDSSTTKLTISSASWLNEANVINATSKTDSCSWYSNRSDSGDIHFSILPTLKLFLENTTRWLLEYWERDCSTSTCMIVWLIYTGGTRISSMTWNPREFQDITANARLPPPNSHERRLLSKTSKTTHRSARPQPGYKDPHQRTGASCASVRERTKNVIDGDKGTCKQGPVRPQGRIATHRLVASSGQWKEMHRRR